MIALDLESPRSRARERLIADRKGITRNKARGSSEDRQRGRAARWIYIPSLVEGI
jgi:hypothetical protein